MPRAVAPVVLVLIVAALVLLSGRVPSLASQAVPAAAAPSGPTGRTAPAAPTADSAAIAKVLDAFHGAAARADEPAYFALLVEPRLEMRAYGYGPPNQRFPCWIVAEATERHLVLAYCEHGFGPSFPWGFLDTRGRFADSLGNDRQWSWCLEEAFVTSERTSPGTCRRRSVSNQASGPRTSEPTELS